MKVIKLECFIFCYILLICDRCYCLNSIALRTNKSRVNMLGSRMLEKMLPPNKQSIITIALSTEEDFLSLPHTPRKRFAISNHQNSASIRDKRTVSIPSLAYYHSKFRMNLIRKQTKEPKKHKCSSRNKFIQMVLSLPIEHRYKFGIPPKDCRCVMCDISGKVTINEKLMFLVMIAYCHLS